MTVFLIFFLQLALGGFWNDNDEPKTETRRRLYGRRRRGQRIWRWASADEDAQLCESVEAYIGENYMDDIVNALQGDGSLVELEAQVAADVADWCIQLSTERRRRSPSNREEDFRRMETMEAWKTPAYLNNTEKENFYVEVVKHRLEDYTHERRRSESDMPEISADMWAQCAGYAAATVKVISDLHQHGAADIMAANLNGGSEDRLNACAMIVNNVNSHLRRNEIPGMEVVTQEDGREAVAVQDESLVSQMQQILGPYALTLTGSLALEFAAFRFYICNSYDALAPAVRRLETLSPC